MSFMLEYKWIKGGKPSIIFMNGFRMRYDSWNKVYPALSLNNSVLVFNRAGVGDSHKAQEKQDGNRVIADMRGLLSSLSITPPYLLVAHSLGGVFANLYVRTYPDEVSGIVFVDSPHPLEIAEQKAITPPVALRFVNDGAKYIEKLFNKYKYSEDEHIDETLHQLANAAPFPEIPIAIVTGIKKMPFVPDAVFDVHVTYQRMMAELSPNSMQYRCHQSGHFPQISEPERVIEAITGVLDQLNTGRPNGRMAI